MKELKLDKSSGEQKAVAFITFHKWNKLKTSLTIKTWNPPN